MRADAVYSVEYGCFIAPPQPEAAKPVIRFDVTKCNIIINEFGFIDLYLGSKKIKRLNYKEFKKYKHYVKEVRDDAYYRNVQG